MRLWDIQKEKWVVLSRKSTTNVWEVETGLMIEIVDRDKTQDVLLKHDVPTVPRLITDSKKKTCQYAISNDMVRNEVALAAIVAFKSHVDFEMFSEIFAESS